MNRTTIKALFLLALLAFPIGKVIAGLSITPAFIRLDKTIQGKKYIIPVMVTNQSAKKTEHFKVAVEGPSSSINGLPAKKVISWTTVKPQKFSIQPGESRKIKMSVKVPKGYTGDYRVYLSITQDPKKYNLKIKKRKIKNSIGIMQLGKTSTRIPEFKTHVKALVKINVPVVIRAIKPGQKIKLRSKQVKFTKFKVVSASDKRKAMTLRSTFENKTRFDVTVKGSCTLLNKKGSKKLMQAKMAQRILVQPKQKAPVSCDFGSALPRGTYQAQGNFKVQIKGTKNIVKINKRQKLKIGKQLANKIAGRGSIGGQDDITTPLLLSPTMFQQEVVGGKVRKLTIEVVNPTSKKFNITSSFRLTNDNRVKVIFKPRKFKLAAGSAKRVSVEFKSKDKKSPIYGWIDFAAKQAKGAPPASIPVLLVPEGLKQSQKLKFNDITAKLTSGNSRIHFATKVINHKKGMEALYLSATIAITNIESGVLVLSSKVALENENLLPGNKIIASSDIDFDRLKDGVYQILIMLSSDEGGVSLKKRVNLVINRDIAQKIKVIDNE
jgi:hypothetical protein